MRHDDISELDKKIRGARGIEKEEKLADSREKADSHIGIQAGAELVAAIAAGIFFGYLIDGYFDTKPVFTMILFILGVCTGFYNVFRLEKTGSVYSKKKVSDCALPEREKRGKKSSKEFN